VVCLAALAAAKTTGYQWLRSVLGSGTLCMVHLVLEIGLDVLTGEESLERKRKARRPAAAMVPGVSQKLLPAKLAAHWPCLVMNP
jgi:hypothetical protein